ncbi:MAG: DUF2953 domain-containing protein [Lachnospiraceae bacterium]|nr:DUF2953 domain-containing protein [Lachnospiraceae bacterium]
MLHIVITILKILGSVLLVILAILAVLLLLVLTALASPIRYHLKGSHHGTLQMTGRITWLFRILGITITYEDEKMDVRISAFGHVFGQGRKASSDRRKKRKKKKDTAKDSETVFSVSETDTYFLTSEDTGDFSQNNTDLPDENHDEQTLCNTDTEKAISSEADSDEPISLNTDSDEPIVMYTDSDEPDLQEDVSEFEKPIRESQEGRTEKKGILDIVKKVISFLQMPSVKKLMKKLLRSLKKIIRHLLPDELKIRGTIGLDDPAQTGRVMEAAAVLYAFYPDHIQITPSFDEKVLEGEAELKGKIVLLYLLIKGIGMALSVLLKKECRGFFQEMKQQMSA